MLNCSDAFFDLFVWFCWTASIQEPSVAEAKLNSEGLPWRGDCSFLWAAAPSEHWFYHFLASHAVCWVVTVLFLSGACPREHIFCAVDILCRKHHRIRASSFPSQQWSWAEWYSSPESRNTLSNYRVQGSKGSESGTAHTLGFGSEKSWRHG